MPPNDADGFRYTPSSYLQRTRVENRPWTASDEHQPEDMEGFALHQEARPLRVETSIDSHFQSRVNRRKEAYRSIIKGHDEPEPMVEVDPLKLTASSSSSGEQTPASASTSRAAREARQRRLSNRMVPRAPASKEDTETARIRNLRAHRLRTSLKATTDEVDAMELLQQRRALQVEQDRVERESQAQRLKEEAAERMKIQEERKLLAQERRLLEQAKQEAALEFQRRRSDLRKNAVSPSTSSETTPSVEPPRRSKRKQKVPVFVRAEREPIHELSLLEELQLLVRDAGVLRSCVHTCFGDEENLDVNDLVEESSDLRAHWTQTVASLASKSR